MNRPRIPLLLLFLLIRVDPRRKKIFGSIGGQRGGETVVDHLRLFREFGSSLGMGPADEDYEIRRKLPLGLRRSSRGRYRFAGPRDRSRRARRMSRGSIDRSTAIGGLVDTDTERISGW